MAETSDVNATQLDHDSRNKPIVVHVHNEQDVARARREAKAIAVVLNFSLITEMEVLIAVTELATNLHVHARPGGRIILKQIQVEDTTGIEVVSVDEGPGIENIELALQDRYSTAGSMGCGLPAVKRLMDDFVLESQTRLGTNCGTRIMTRKWLK